jgi:glycosyltransferase involved in cell wall biosynthesis
MKLLVPVEKSGVQYWRTRTPLWALEERGIIETRYFDARQFDSREVSNGLKWCDAVVFRGAANTSGLELIRAYQGMGKPCFVDQDDFNFDVDPLNPAYVRFGTEEVEIETEAGRQWLWKDGVDGFDLKANRVKAGAGLSILQEAYLITTTTPYLKQKFVELSGREVYVIPNAVNMSLWKPMPNARDHYKDGFRLGWMISDSHGSDLLYIRETLKKFLLAHPDAKLVIMGDCGGVKLEDYFPANQIEWHAFADLYEQHYPVLASCLGLDVAIAPLAHTEFNRCKSPLKFTEYTALGYPCILEDIETYNVYARSGEEALLAGDPDQWMFALNRLYNDKSLRAKLHFTAAQFCKQFFDVNKVCMDWYSTYKWVLENIGAVKR